MKLAPACGYMGSKRKFGAQIVEVLLESNPSYVFDLCCGTGSVFLAAINAGVPPEKITVVEAGMWGAYWAAISNGTFDLGRFTKLLTTDMPTDGRLVKQWVETEVAAMPPSPETFIVLQAAAYGSVPVWWDGKRWRHNEEAANRGYHARGYWEPGPSSKEKKPRGTIFAPKKIIQAVTAHTKHCEGTQVVHGNVEEADLSAPGRAVYYMDPPYTGVAGYGHGLDVLAFIQKAPRPLYVSEHIALPGATRVLELGARRSSNITKGNNARVREVELLNVYE